MLRRLSLLLGAGALVVAVGAAPVFAGGESAYVTETQDCEYPLDLQVNQLGTLEDAYVWLKRVTEAQVEEDLVWSLYQGGVQVGDGTFEFICTTTDGKYTLAYPGFFDDEFDGTGTYTVKVDWFTIGGVNYSGDSFSVEAAQ